MNINDVPVLKESARGCGRRKNGHYLVTDAQHLAPCGKLPLKLERCPCCDGGIKPARGWTWINPVLLFKDVGCVGKCRFSCAMSGDGLPQIGDRAGLLWCGEKFYPTPADWIKEAVTMGISRRIKGVPKDFELGKTWVFMAHRKVFASPCPNCGEGRDESHLPKGVILAPIDTTGSSDGAYGPVGIDCPTCGNQKLGEKGVLWTPGIFHVFLPKRIEYVVKGDETDEQLDKLVSRGLTPVKVEPLIDEPVQSESQPELSEVVNG